MASSPHSDTTTEGIRVEAAAQYRPDESDPDRQRFLYSYQIRISNVGERPAKLLTRHWIILDANNHREEVRGDGVVGRQPDLAPGATHVYESSCPLRTTWGTMEGTYTFERPDHSRFQVVIGRFFLVPSAPPLPPLEKQRA